MVTCHNCNKRTRSAISSGWIEISKPGERKHKWQCLKCTDKLNPSRGTIATYKI